MALLTRKELAERCGLKKSTARAYIGTNIKRGKIILSGDFIDDSIPENSEFIANCIAKNGSKQNPEPKPAAVSKPNVQPPKKPEPEKPNASDPDMIVVGMDRKLKAQTLEKLKAETEYKELQVRKMRGDMLPTDIVKSIFIQHSQSIVTEFKNCCEDIVTIFGKKKGLNTNEMAEIRGELVASINVAMDKSVETSAKTIKNIIAEISVKRGVGERG